MPLDDAPYTDRVRRAMGLAVRFAASSGDREVTPAYIMAGLLAMERSVARDILRSLGVDIRALAGVFPPVPSLSAHPVRADGVGYDGAASAVIDSARAAARQLQAGHIGTEHLLLALLEAGGAEVRRELTSVGLKPGAVRLQVLQRMGAPAGRLAQARLYVLLTEELASQPLLEAAQALIDGGADIIQYREKELPDGPFLANALVLRQMTRDAGVLFVINDRVDVALLCNADGVHLGQTDLPVIQARRLLGPTRIVGTSTHNESEARAALGQAPDYIAAGSMFATATKEQPQMGGPLYLSKLLREIEPDCPVYPIGGITLENLSQVLAVGADRVAVCSAIISQPDIRGACAAFKEALESAGQ